MKKIVSIICFAVFLLGSAFAKDFYVSKDKGSNRNPGTKDKPIKNLQKAIKKAKKGDKIFVAEGNYYGLLNKGSITIDKSVEIYGGYSKDFSKRDVLKYRTLIAPPASTNGTADNAGTLNFKKNIKDKGTLIIDGIIFDKSESNAYHPTKGKPKGVDTGMYIAPPGKGKRGHIAAGTRILGGGYIDNSNLIIRNCVFNNAEKYAVWITTRGTCKIKILNNVFTSSIYAACEVTGTPSSSMEFAYNTVLFNWARTKQMDTLGYGFRCMTGLQTTVHNNLIGLSNGAGLDRTRVDENQQMDIDNNMFFMNGKADMILPGAGLYLRIFVESFDDVEAITSSEGNSELSPAAGKALKAVLNKPYLEGFLSATYSEKADYDANSSTNTALRALGLNQIGKVSSSVSMWGNCYPLKDSLKLFGVIKGFGAQKIK